MDEVERNEPQARPKVICGPSRTKQAGSEASDINKIMATVKRGGPLTHISKSIAEYGNFTEAPDLHEAMTRVTDAQFEFMRLPARIREAFDNDPAKIVEYMGDERNREECESIGLFESRTVPTEQKMLDTLAEIRDSLKAAAAAEDTPEGPA